jgi:hypothetical protein
LDGDGEGLGELVDGEGELDPVELAESLGDGLVLALPEGLAVAERLVVEARVRGVLATVSSVAPMVLVTAAVVLMCEVFLAE